MKKISNKITLIFVLSAIMFLIGSFLFSHFNSSLNPGFGLAHAQDTGLHADLTSPGTADTGWVFEIWKIALALANVVVIAMLLFVAIVNIVHLQYDTYAIKKSLPLLIVGIIMANFSLLICRMIVDTATVLANTFASNPTKLAGDLLNGFGFTGASTTGTTATIVSLLLNPIGSVGGALIIIILVLVAVLIAVFILAFLLMARKYVIFLLVAISPVAFILYAFPPTQGVFKTWWSWFIKWTFMGPIVMFLVWAASKIGANNASIAVGGGGNFSISALLAECAVLYLAAIVPFKLGGGVMGAWAKAGKWATGTNSGGYLKKPIDESIQRKKEIAKGAFGTAWGSTKMGKWGDKGKKNEEGLIANYKNVRDTQLSDADKTVREHHGDFRENEEELERSKNRLNTQNDKQLKSYLNRHGESVQKEEIDAKNAKGDVTKIKSEAEQTVRTKMGHKQTITEQEVAKAEQDLKTLIGENEQDVREGRFSDVPTANIQALTGGQAKKAIDVKKRYLRSDNRANLLAERVSKRGGQDAQLLAGVDLRYNDDLRKSFDEMKEFADDRIDSQFDAEGKAITGTPEKITYTKALELAEQLRYKASGAEGKAKDDYDAAAQYFEAQADTFATSHQTFTSANADKMDTSTVNLQLAADAETNVEEKRKKQVKADSAREAASIARKRIGEKIDYKTYLTNNLAGRRQKIKNPDIADEIHTQVISTGSEELIDQVLVDKSFGTGERRANFDDMAKSINGRMCDVEPSAADAVMVQMGAIHENMKTARHGEAKGLKEINGFMKIMDAAGRTNFKAAATKQAMNSMPEASRAKFQEELARKKLGKTPVEWRSTPIADRDAAWSTLSAADQEDAITKVDFEKLDLKAQGPSGTSQRDFVDRFMDMIEEDPALGLSNSAGSRVAKTRSVSDQEFIENK